MREYEVLIGDQLDPLRQAEPHSGELRNLDEELQDNRKGALARARKVVESDRFVRSDCVPRYSSDFFAGQFGAKRQRSRRKTFGEILKSLQGALGRLNDIEMHRRLAKKIVHSRRPLAKKAEKSFAIGVITGGERRQAAACLTAARQAGRELATATPFWQ